MQLSLFNDLLVYVINTIFPLKFLAGLGGCTHQGPIYIGSFNLCQLFENQVVKVSKKGWHSLKYCVNIIIICINKRLTICLIKKYIKNKKSETLRKINKIWHGPEKKKEKWHNFKHFNSKI